MEGNEVMLWGPAPPEIELNMAWTEHYLFAREVKINSDNLLSPLGNVKEIMKNFQNNLVYYGLILAFGELVFNILSRKYEKKTIIQVYKIDLLSIKIIRLIQKTSFSISSNSS